MQVRSTYAYAHTHIICVAYTYMHIAQCTCMCMCVYTLHMHLAVKGECVLCMCSRAVELRSVGCGMTAGGERQTPHPGCNSWPISS